MYRNVFDSNEVKVMRKVADELGLEYKVVEAIIRWFYRYLVLRLTKKDLFETDVVNEKTNVRIPGLGMLYVVKHRLSIIDKKIEHEKSKIIERELKRKQKLKWERISKSKDVDGSSVDDNSQEEDDKFWSSALEGE